MLNNCYAPSFKQIIEHCQELDNESEILDYLSEVASNDFKCPDKCDLWATDFYNEFKLLIDTLR